MSLPSSDDRSLAQLFELATPELYRRNAFRVLGMEVDAETGDARRRQKKLKRSEALGLREANSVGLLALEESPSPELLQQAQRRIQDPLSRLADEFFWFWPRENQQPDEALELLRSGKTADARRIFCEREAQENDWVATHNLAVLDHLTALDHEQHAAFVVLRDEARAARDAAWRECLSRWRRLLGEESIWTRIRDRISEIDDPRLTSDLVTPFRATLEEMLLLLSARLAVQAAERKDPGDVARHLGLLQTSGFELSLVHQALRRSLAPVDERARIACRKADQATDADPAVGLQVASNLLRESIGAIGLVDSMLPADDALRQGLHDEVARIALRCLIAYGNQTEDWQGAREALERLLAQLKPSDAMRQRVEENLHTVGENAAATVCHYCGQAAGSNPLSVTVNMHGDIQSSMVDYQTQRTTWRHSALKIPRCAACHGAHEQVVQFKETFTGICGCIMLAEIFLSVIYANVVPLGQTGNQILTVLVVVIVVASLAALKYYEEAQAIAMLPVGCKPFDDFKSHPLVAECLAKGWKFGSAPGKSDFHTPPATAAETNSVRSGKPAAGCPKCELEHWWKNGACSLCDATGEVELDSSLNAMIKILELGPMLMAQVVNAMQSGRRGTAAALLMKCGKSAEETKQIILGWECRQKK